MRVAILTCCAALLGETPGAARAALDADPRGAAATTNGPSPVAAPPSRPAGFPGRDVVDAFLRGGPRGGGDAALDEPLSRRSAALALLSDPAALSPIDSAPGPDAIEEAVNALLASPDEADAPGPPRACALRPGTAQDRELLAPTLYTAAESDRMRTLVVETRARIDGAVPVVATCGDEPDQLFLVDVARRKSVARRVPEPPQRHRLIVIPRSWDRPRERAVTAAITVGVVGSRSSTSCGHGANTVS